jgi:hypothetical protein
MNIAHPITDPYLRLKITCKNKTLYLRHSYVQDNIFNLDSNRKKNSDGRQSIISDKWLMGLLLSFFAL